MRFSSVDVWFRARNPGSTWQNDSRLDQFVLAAERPVDRVSHKNLAYYAGCNGHGIPQCTLMGAAIADEMLGESSASTEVLKRFGIPLPPEPVRWALLHAIKGYLARVDRRVDRELRAGRAP